ncbi:MAG: hypothetical protein GVY28_04735 [Alphaproteobacteria bacterium]|jgi:hypothetical protein|nr:hypothetical protein [Alphaproteobacteria bacterium]
MNARLVGIALFVVAAVLAVGFYLFGQGGDGAGDRVTTAILGERPAEIRAMGFIGGEKTAFLANPEVQEILEDDYGITLDARRAGSLEMVSEAALIDQGADFYWPASQVSVEIARDNGLAPVQTEIVFNAPIVLFSWSPVAAALEAAGLARSLTPERAAFAVDTRALLERVLAEESWDSLGLDRLYGGVMVTSTNPLFSNSGNQFAMLATMVLSDGETTGPAFDDAVGKVASIYERMGYTERSSSTLFEQYLRQGMGAYPIVAGYESQLIEFAAADRDLWQSLEGREIRPVILYPEPTVFSSHVLLAMGEPGRAVIEALRDERLQDLAWAQHGFRSGFAASNDPSILPLAGIPDQVGMVIPMPPFTAVQAILTAIGESQG